MDKKKIVKSFIVGAGIGVVLLVFWGLLKEREKELDIGPSPTIGASFPNREAVPTIKLPPIRGGKLIISGVEVEDFLRSPEKVNDEGDVLIVSEKEFQILYFVDEESFLISIVDSPFEEIRRKAEERFLEKVGIGRAEACGLDVRVSTPLFANPAQAGKNFGLSFCR